MNFWLGLFRHRELLTHSEPESPAPVAVSLWFLRLSAQRTKKGRLKVRTWLAVLSIVGCTACGCSREKVEQLAAQIQEKAKASVPSMASVPKSIAGKITLSIGNEITTPGALCSTIKIEGRPAVIQLRSNAVGARETFPSVFFQGQLDCSAAELAAERLVGRTISGQLFVQADASAPVLSCEPGKEVSLRFEAIEGTELIGKFVEGEVGNAQGQKFPVTGSFRVLHSEATVAQLPSGSSAP